MGIGCLYPIFISTSNSKLIFHDWHFKIQRNQNLILLDFFFTHEIGHLKASPYNAKKCLHPSENTRGLLIFQPVTFQDVPRTIKMTIKIHKLFHPCNLEKVRKCYSFSFTDGGAEAQESYKFLSKGLQVTTTFSSFFCK